jgi:hypothetical protein
MPEKKLLLKIKSVKKFGMEKMHFLIVFLIPLKNISKPFKKIWKMTIKTNDIHDTYIFQEQTYLSYLS